MSVAARVRPWLLAARPQTLPAGVLPVVLATALAWHDSAARPRTAFLAALGAMAIQIGTNLFNDYADFYRGADTAMRLGPMRVTQQGLIVPKHVLYSAVGAFVAAAVCGLGLIAAGGVPIILVGLVSIALGFLYTGGPYPLAYHGLGDLFVFVFFGLVATSATYYLHTGVISQESLFCGAALGLFATGILVVNNLRDRFTDAAAHKRTLAVRFGARAARMQYALCMALPYAVLPALLGAGTWWRLLPLLTAPWALRLVMIVRRLDGASLNPLLGATARLEMAYTVLLSLGLLP